MKWAIFVTTFPPENISGSSVYASRFSRALTNSGDAVHVFTTTLNPNLPKEEEMSGVIIHRVFIATGATGSLNPVITSRLVALFNEVDANTGFEFLNLHAPFPVFLFRIRKNLKIIYTLHAVRTYEYLFDLKKIINNLYCPKSYLKELLLSPFRIPLTYSCESIVLRRAFKIVTMSKYSKITLSNYFPFVDLTKINVSRIGIDMPLPGNGKTKAAARKELGLPENEIIFLTVRRLVLRMGIENLIKAFDLCCRKSDEKIRLIIIGDGPLSGILQNLIGRMDPPQRERIKLTGYLPEPELIKYYRSSDAFVLPTEQLECFGIVSLEALSFNLPVISTPVGANKEVAGFFCPELITRSSSAVDIADRMTFFLRNKQKYMSASFSGKLEKHYSWPKIIEDLKRTI